MIRSQQEMHSPLFYSSDLIPISSEWFTQINERKWLLTVIIIEHFCIVTLPEPINNLAILWVVFFLDFLIEAVLKIWQKVTSTFESIFLWMWCFFVFFLHTERETKIRLQVVTWDILIPTDILWGIHLWSDYPRPFLMPGVNRHLDREQWLTDSYPCRAQSWLPQKCVRLLKPSPVRITKCKQI